MIVHVASVVAGIALTVWSTVLTQYHQFRDPSYVPPVRVDVEIPELATPTGPTALEEAVNEIVRTTGETRTEGQALLPMAPGPTVAPKPFTPLPIPTQPVISTPTVPTATTSPVVESIEDNRTSEAVLKAAIVNIICLQEGGRGTSGTGVVIDPRGIIVTVAHIGQNFILKDYPDTGSGQCYIRTGSPAKNTYLAELVYISTEWVDDNGTVFLESRPKGTGENDYAFLAITGSATSAALPSRFSYIPMSLPNVDIEEGDTVGVGSYGAEFLTSSQVRSSLYPTISFAPINDIFTFDRTTKDSISVRAGAAAQEGSSGGAVMDADKRLIGVITTRTVRSDLSLRDLQAITMNHIRESFRQDMGTNLDIYLANNGTASLVNKFSGTRAELLERYAEVIESR